MKEEPEFTIAGAIVFVGAMLILTPGGWIVCAILVAGIASCVGHR